MPFLLIVQTKSTPDYLFIYLFFSPSILLLTVLTPEFHGLLHELDRAPLVPFGNALSVHGVFQKVVDLYFLTLSFFLLRNCLPLHDPDPPQFMFFLKINGDIFAVVC